MGFKFRLETLLRIRKRMEEVAEMELSVAISKRHELEEQLHGEKNRLKQEISNLNKKMEEGIMSGELSLRCQLISQMEQKCRELDRRLKQANLHVAQARGVFTQRHVESELVRGLRDRDLKRYLKEVDAKLQRELDELVSLGQARIRGAQMAEEDELSQEHPDLSGEDAPAWSQEEGRDRGSPDQAK